MKYFKVLTATIVFIAIAGFLWFNIHISNRPPSQTARPPDVVSTERQYGTVQEHGKIQHISLINLISTPEKYHGKWVRVQGVANFEFEGNALFLHKEDYKLATKNAVWLSPNMSVLKVNETILAKEFNGKQVIIEGVFNMYNHGHMDLFSGSIENVSRILSWKLVSQNVSN